jgi:lactonase
MEHPSMKSMKLIPPSERNLPVIMAEPWLQVVTEPCIPEAPAFDRDGNLFLTHTGGYIYRVTRDGKIDTIFKDTSYIPTGIAIHKDGRLFVVCPSGQFFTINSDGSDRVNLTARYNGKPTMPDDLVFDVNGNLYITDIAGTPTTAPLGGVYRLSADLSTVHAITENLVTANGISIAPPNIVGPIPTAAYQLWVSETFTNRILSIRLQEDGVTPGHPCVEVVYYCAGELGPDSNAVDCEGNLYQAMVGQGRVLIFNSIGIPVAQVLVPGRDEGKSLMTTNVAFEPGTDIGVITAGGPDGGWIYRFKGLAIGEKLFSHG